MAEVNGWLYKLGAKGVVKGWKKRWCSLQGPRIRYYKQKSDPDFQGFIDLNLASGVSQNSQKKTSQAAFTFEITTPDRIWYLAADTNDERARWVAAIEAAITELKSKISFSRSTPSLASTAPLGVSTVRNSPLAPSVPSSRALPMPPSQTASTQTSGGPPALPPKPTSNQFRPELPRRGKSADITTNLITPIDRGSAAMLQANRPAELPPRVQALALQTAPKASSQPASPATSPRVSPRQNQLQETLNLTQSYNEPADVPEQPRLSETISARRMRRSLSAPHLIEQMSADEAVKVAAKRDNLAKEILQTEKAYVDSLQCMIQHYMMPMSAATRNKTAPVCFNDEDIRNIFSNNLTLIVGVNLELLKSLEARVQSWSESQKLGDVFLTMAPFLKMYFDYGANYDNAISTYNKLMKDPSFGPLLNTFRAASGKPLSLEHLLIMPIQRIPRYTLLLGELLKSTQPNHPDYEDLKKAIKSLEDTTMHINESMKRSDAINKVVVSGLADFVAPHRYLMFDGIIEVRVNGAKTKSEIRLVVFNDLVLHVSRSKARDRQTLASYEAQSSIVTVWVKPSVHVQNAWDLLLPRRVYTFETKTLEEKDALHQLQQALTKHFGGENVPSERQHRCLFTDDIVYDGRWVDGQFEGIGTLQQFACGVYEGSWSKGSRCGRGKQLWINGAMYEGDWKDNVPHGRGSMSWPSGDSYSGEFESGYRTGKGEFRYANGDTYKGEFHMDRPHGVGTLLSVSGRYEGSWISGVFHGEGKFVDAAGREYVGGWINGLMEGQGDMTYNNLTSYTGKWKEGRRHGKGMFRQAAPNGAKLVYQGDWENDLKQGHGQMTYFDGSFYDGQWKEDKRHGQGRFGFRNNDSCGRVLYEGDWQHDRMTGKGVLTFSSGEKYEGLFKDGLYNGPGVYFYADGRRIEGKWSSGGLEGKVNYAAEPKLEHQKKATGIIISGQQSNNSILPSSRAWPDLSIVMPAQIPQITLPYLN